MWTCEHCGCQAIAASVANCPMCRKGRDMPKTTTGGGTNAWEPGPEPEPAAASVSAPEPVAEVVPPAPPAPPEPPKPPPAPAAVTPKAAKPAEAVSEPPAVTGTGSLGLPSLGARNG